ncbi:MAG: FUSC family protein [Actinomycetota bacterium]|nr:FUSC family protein [Actinomycetota bacterium]
MFKGLAQLPAMPDAAAVLRSLLGVIAVAVVAVRWGPPGSATAAAGAAAVAGAVALQDSPRRRIPIVAGTAAVLGGAVLLGTSVSWFTPAYVAAVAAWCFAAAMPWALGANAGLIGAASGALLVVVPPAAPTLWSTFGTAALCFGGGLLQAGLIAVWPQHRWRVQRDALAAAYRSLAADARRMADGQEGAVGADPQPLIALRAAFTVVDGQARRHPADYRSWYGLPERIAATLTDLAERTAEAPPTKVLEAASDTLAAVAETRRSAREDAEAAIARLDGVIDTVADTEAGLVNRLSALLHEAVAVRLGDFLPSSPEAVRVRRPELRTSLRSALALMSAHLNRHSPVLRHAVRLAVAVGAGCAIERYTEVAHGYWIPLTALMVLRPETAHTYTRCMGRIAGTVAGVAVASVMLTLLEPGALVAGVLVIAFVGIAYAAAGFGYLALSAALAAAVVFLIDLDRIAPPATTDDRLFGALIGGALALLVHVLLPDDSLTRLSQRAGELLKTEVDYAATVIKAYVHELDNTAGALSAAWQRAFRARAAFEAAAGAARLDSRELRRWMGSYRTALNAVTASCTTLESALPDQPGTAWSGEFVLAVDEYVESLCGDPPTAASPWTVDRVEVQAADKRLRDVVPRHGTHEGAARVLVAEVATITRNVSAIAVTPGPTAAR